MKNLKLKAITLLLILTLKIQAQTEISDFTCVTQSSQTTQSFSFDPTHSVGACASYNGYCHTPKGNLHILFLYVGFNDETSANNAWGWDYDKLPDYAQGYPNDLADHDPASPSGRSNLTNWYSNMSNKYFTITGEAFFVRVNRVYDPLTGYNYGLMATYAIQQLQADHPNEDWSRFDNRQNIPGWNYDNSRYYYNTTTTPPTYEGVRGDNIIDYLVVNFRILTGPGSGGEREDLYTGKSITTTYNGGNTYDFNCGHWAQTLAPDKDHHEMLFKHEFGHALWKSPHYMGANSIVGKRFYKNRGWGMMSEMHHIINTTNSWEEWWLNWMTVQNINVQNINANGKYYLKDYVEEDDAIRIQIPEAPNHYLWIENHQKINSLDDKVFFKDQSPASTGIYAYITNGNPDCTNPDNFSYDNINDANSFKIVSAQSNFDYSFSGTSPNVSITRGNINSISGQTDLTVIRNDFNRNGTIEICTNPNSEDITCYPNPNNEQLSYAGSTGTGYNWTGSADDAFQLNGEIGLSGKLPVLNFPIFNESTTHSLNDPFFLNGLSVKITNYNSTNHEYEVQVKFDDWNVGNDQRWTGNLQLNNLSNDNSPDLLIKSGATLTINKSGTPNTNVNTTFSDFIIPTLLTCKSGSYMKMEPNSNLIVDENSTLRLESGSILEINNAATIQVKNSSKLTLEDGAQLVVNDGGRVYFEDEGQLIYNNNGQIYLNGNSSVLEIKDGGKIMVGANTIFAWNGKGYLKVTANPAHLGTSNILGTGPNSKVEIRGAYNGGLYDQKVIEVSSGSLSVDKTISDFKVISGHIIMGQNAILDVESPMFLSGVKVTSTSPNIIHGGLWAYGQQSTLYVNKCTFENAGVGIRIHSAKGLSNVAKFTSSTFKNCGTGIIVYGKGAEIDHCKFWGNNKGTAIALNTVQNNCLIDNVEAYGLDRGIDVVGSSSNLITIRNSNIHNNSTVGVMGINSTISPGCSYIKNNYVLTSSTPAPGNNLMQSFASYLAMDPSLNANSGNCDLFSLEGVSIETNKTFGLFLDRANSMLAVGNPGLAIHGTFEPVTFGNPPVSVLTTSMIARSNYWSAGGAPVKYGDYTIFYNLWTPLYIDIDDKGQSLSGPPAVVACSTGSGSDIVCCDHAIFGKKALLPIPGSTDVKTVFLEGLNDMLSNPPDYNSAIEKFSEVISYDYSTAIIIDSLSGDSTSEFGIWHDVIDLAYVKMLECLSEGSATGQIDTSEYSNRIQDFIGIQNHLLVLIGLDDNNTNRKFRIFTDRAMIYRLFGYRSTAIDLLNNLLSWDMSTDQMNLLQYYICAVSKEVQIIEGSLAKADYYVNECLSILELPDYGDPNQIFEGPSDEQYGGDTYGKKGVDNKHNNSMNNQTPIGSGNQLTDQVIVYPNPANDLVYISMPVINIQTNIEILDITGRLVLSRFINSENLISLPVDIDNGSYFIQIKFDNNIIRKKIIIVK